VNHHTDIGAETVLKVAGLSKVFPVRSGLLGRGGEVIRAVDDISLTVRKGETLGLVGESGCGKSTAGKTIMRLYEPTSGTISLKGQDITRLRGRALRAIRRELQIVFQDPFSSLNPRMTAGRIVGEPLTIHGLARGSKKADRVAELFHRVGLRPDQMRRYPHEFSGGQRQRLAIARALSVDPDLIVADESVSALDVSIQASIINLMMDIQKEHGLSFLFIAHDIAVVEHISHKIAVMYLGRIVEMGPRARIVTAPRHPYTKALLSAVPVPDPNRKPDPFRLKGDVPSPINPPSGCTFHTRCPLAFDRCRIEAPAFREVVPGQFSACHLDIAEDAP
jgi:peptide/nickel transport system ATP-binding protein/oligopeptide transport system ATP-binding protein